MLKISGLQKSYLNHPDNVVFGNLNLEIQEGEFVSIFGPNGCGKSTLLNAIAGLTNIDKGEIQFNNLKVKDLNIGFVFQDYKNSLFPWLNMRDNISYPLKIKNIPQTKINRLINKLYIKYNCNFNLNDYPYELSGGQQQLGSLLRGLILKPDLFLLDEPFSSLDYQTTLILLSKLNNMWTNFRLTTLFVSHDIDDAIFLSQKIILLSNKPTRIIKTFEVPQGYPRKLSFIGSNEFNKIKKDILSLYTKEITLN